MFGLKASTILSLLAVFHASSAIPFGQLTSMMPRDVAYIGVDEDRGEYVAYNLDGTTYGRYAIDSKGESVSKRAAGKCANLSIDELKTIPGWNALNQYADSTWGTGKREVVTNPEEYLDSPAQVCITDEVVNLNFHEEPICQEHTSSVSGILIGTEGEVSIEVEQGFNTATSYTVTSASTIGVSSTLSVSMGIPAVADVSAELTVNTEITDEVSSTFEVSYNDISRVSLTITAAEGEKCTAETTVKTCNRQATGEVRYLASGWVWFNYHKRTQGHYKWAASIEGVLTNQDDRSSFAEFKGAMSSDSRSSYQGTCV